MAERIDFLIRQHKTEPNGETFRVIPSRGLTFEEAKLAHIKEMVEGTYYEHFEWFNDQPDEEKDFDALVRDWEEYTTKAFGSPQTFQWHRAAKIEQEKKVTEICLLCGILRQTIKRQRKDIDTLEGTIQWQENVVFDKEREIECKDSMIERLSKRVEKLTRENLELKLAYSRASGVLSSS